MFHYKPSSYWCISIYGNPDIYIYDIIYSPVYHHSRSVWAKAKTRMVIADITMSHPPVTEAWSIPKIHENTTISLVVHSFHRCFHGFHRCFACFCYWFLSMFHCFHRFLDIVFIDVPWFLSWMAKNSSDLAKSIQLPASTSPWKARNCCCPARGKELSPLRLKNHWMYPYTTLFFGVFHCFLMCLFFFFVSFFEASKTKNTTGFLGVPNYQSTSPSFPLYAIVRSWNLG